MNGSEDRIVHCIKRAGGTAADAAAAISANAVTLLRDVNENVDTDPFASDKEFEDNDKTIVQCR